MLEYVPLWWFMDKYTSWSNPTLSHTHKIKSGQTCVSQHPSESGHFDPLDLFQGSNLGHSGLMGQGPGLSCTYHFTMISSGSWRTRWSSWAKEPLWRKQSQHTNKLNKTKSDLFTSTLQQLSCDHIVKGGGGSLVKTLFPFLKATHSCILNARIPNIHRIWTVPVFTTLPHPVQLHTCCQHFLPLLSVCRWSEGLPLDLGDLGVLAITPPRKKCK